MRYNKKIRGKEKILHAAVKTITGYVVIGKCHADCFWSGKIIGLEMSNKSSDQGFVTNKGRYVGRKKAFIIAKRANQLSSTDRRKANYLISEDIWHQRPRFEYSQCRGYHEVIND